MDPACDSVDTTVFAAVLENRSGMVGCAVINTAKAQLFLHSVCESSASCVNTLSLLEALQPSAVLVCAGGANVLRCFANVAAESPSLSRVLVVKERSAFDDTRGASMVRVAAREQDKVRAPFQTSPNCIITWRADAKRERCAAGQR